MNDTVHVAPLYEGTFSVGKDEKFKKIDKQGKPERGSLKLSVNPFLISDGERNILFDAGLGDLFGTGTSIDTISRNLSMHSLTEYDITDVFLSHLHFDHMGGLANRKNGFWGLTFPNAEIWVSGDGWEKLHQTIDQHSEDEADFFHFLDSRASLSFLSEKDQPISHIRVERIGGHTKFHNALFYENENYRYLMAGDVIGSLSTINRTYAAKYDFAPKESMKKREELKLQAFEEGYTIMAYHETASPLFKLVAYDKKKGYTIEKLS